MYLSQVHIENFRCFKRFDIEFRKGLNVIVGENNIGKTNLIDAIRIALGPGATGYNRLQAQKADLYRDSNGNSTTFFLIQLTFADISQDEMADFIECLTYDPKNPTGSKLTISYRWTWNEITQRYTDIRWGGTNENERMANDALQSFLFTYLEPLRDALSYLVAGRASRIATLLQTLSTDAERETLVELFKKTNEELEKDSLVKRATDLIEKNLRSATSSVLAQNVRLATATPKFDAIVSYLSLNLRFPQTNEQGNAVAFFDAEIKENGLGYNNLLYMATVLAELSRVKAGDVPMLVVEEPEAHLHPQLQTFEVYPKSWTDWIMNIIQPRSTRNGNPTNLYRRIQDRAHLGSAHGRFHTCGAVSPSSTQPTTTCRVESGVSGECPAGLST